MNKKELGSLIQRSIGVRQISRRELCEFLKVNKSTIGHWCRGAAIPLPPKQKKLFEFFEEKDKTFAEPPVELLTPAHFAPLNQARAEKKKRIAIENLKKNT